MNVLRNQILHEVAELDVKSLLALQPILEVLKRKPESSFPGKRGVAAAHSREILAGLKGGLSEFVAKERKDRL